jgi:hypothetical protein
MASFPLRHRLRFQLYTFERYSEHVCTGQAAFAERFSSAATNSIGFPAPRSIRRRLSSSGVQKVRANDAFPFAFTSPEPLFRETRRAFGRPKDCDGVAVQSRKGPCPMLPSPATDHRPPVSIARRSNGDRPFLPLLRPFQQRRNLAAPPSAGCLRPAHGSCTG